MFEKSSNKKNINNKYSNKKVKNISKQPNSKSKNMSSRRQYVSRRPEIYGILIIALSIIFFLSFFSFGKPGIITDYVNNLLAYIFGIIKYFAALLLFIWGISFFIKRTKFLPSRFGWGFIMLFISVSGLISSNIKHPDIFDAVLVKARGGITGAGIYYGLYRLMGDAGAITILAVLAIIGILIITRLSIIDLIRKISAVSKKRRENKEIIFQDKVAPAMGPGTGRPGKLFQNKVPESKKLKIYDTEVRPPQNSAPNISSFEEKQKKSRVFDVEKNTGGPAS